MAYLVGGVTVPLEKIGHCIVWGSTCLDSVIAAEADSRKLLVCFHYMFDEIAKSRMSFLIKLQNP